MRAIRLAILVLCIPVTTFGQGVEGALGVTDRYLNKENITGTDADSIRIKGELPNKQKPPESSFSNVLTDGTLTVFGDTSLKPNILTKFRYQRRDYLYFAGRILVGFTDDTPDSANVGTHVFLDEASKLAVQFEGSWTPRSRGRLSNDFAFGFGFSYAQKRLAKTDSTELDTGVLHFFFGGELQLVHDRMSVYAEMNILSVQHDVDGFRSVFGEDVTRDYVYGQYGIRARFSEKLFVDLSFIGLNNDMRTIVGKDDGLIPVGRIGFTHNLAGPSGG